MQYQMYPMMAENGISVWQIQLATAMGELGLPAVDSWRDPANLSLDIPLSQLIASKGWSSQALQWMDIGNSFSSLQTISALDALRRDALRR